MAVSERAPLHVALLRGINVGGKNKALHVAFLMDKPGVAEVRSLDPGRSPPDEFTVRGMETFLYCPNGLSQIARGMRC